MNHYTRPGGDSLSVGIGKEIVEENLAVGHTIAERFEAPDGYERTKETEGSFGVYLRNLPLKPEGAPVLYYDGRQKANHGVYEAVVDLPVGNKDLHQCADAVMRLRAEYLYMKEDYQAIHFNFTNGFRADYSQWMDGNRIAVKGNNASWKQAGPASNTYKDFWNYLEIIFMYAGTLSLSKEMNPVPVSEMQIGDVFIQGGSPGHAVIVVDMALDPVNGRKIFLLAQSYMPAQEIQVLQNPTDRKLSPWYPLEFGEILTTPEWIFSAGDLKRFNEH